MGKMELDTGTEELLCELEDHVATITFNRPEKRNALSNRLTPALRAILLELETHPAVRCVLITGAGNAFCAGGDVSGMGEDRAKANENPPTLEDSIRTLQHKQESLTLRLHQLSKPTLAALPGAAAGAGLSIALACDLRIAADTAFITTAFANIGLSGDYGGSWFLSQLVGLAKAKELYFTADRVPAEECRALGIFNRVVPGEELAKEARAWAVQIAQGPPVALRYMKENLNRTRSADLKTCLELEADRMVRCTQTEDHRKAVQAFLAKESPRFVGR